MAATRDYSKIRLILLGVELIFSLVVFICACVWVSALSTSNINFCLFVGLTSFLLCFFFLFIQLKKNDDRGFLLIQFAIFIVYWIFWLSAAAASADTVSWVNGWANFEGACNKASIYGFSQDYCDANGKKGAVRAVCAFAWLTWAVWTAHIALIVIEDIMGKKILSSKPATAPPADAPVTDAVKDVAASPEVETATEAVADAAAKV